MKELLKPLIAAAIRAPSGDNCQPWAFRMDTQDRLLIEIVPKRAKSFFDFQHRATFLSVGAVLENLRIEAAEHGQGIITTYPSGTHENDPAATFSLSAKDGIKRPAGIHRAMQERTVNRRPFTRKRPTAATISTLTKNPAPHTETRIYTDRQEIGRWARMIYLADRIRYSHPIIHEELFSKILLNREQIKKKRMGLEYDRLGIGPGGSAILKLLKPWTRMKRLSRFGVDAGLSSQSRLLMLSSGAVGLVTIPDNSSENWMHGGEQVERLWVTAQHLGLSVHPMTVALYLSQRYTEEGMDNFLPHHEPWLKEISATLAPFLDGRVGVMVFRIGKALKMSGQAVRLPIDDFLPIQDTESGP